MFGNASLRVADAPANSIRVGNSPPAHGMT